MPRYFFHSQDGELVCDDEGVELEDVEAAKLEARKYLGELLRFDTALSDPLTVRVTDEAGGVLHSITATGTDR